jgi:hypothetical protein
MALLLGDAALRRRGRRATAASRTWENGDERTMHRAAAGAAAGEGPHASSVSAPEAQRRCCAPCGNHPALNWLEPAGGAHAWRRTLADGIRRRRLTGAGTSKAHLRRTATRLAGPADASSAAAARIASGSGGAPLAAAQLLRSPRRKPQRVQFAQMDARRRCRCVVRSSLTALFEHVDRVEDRRAMARSRPSSTLRQLRAAVLPIRRRTSGVPSTWMTDDSRCVSSARHFDRSGRRPALAAERHVQPAARHLAIFKRHFDRHVVPALCRRRCATGALTRKAWVALTRPVRGEEVLTFDDGADAAAAARRHRASPCQS